MNLLQTLLEAQGGQMVGKLAQNFGLDQSQASAALQHLVPLLAGGVQRNMGQTGGLEALLGALKGGNHSRYLEDTSHIASPTTVTDGNAILGHLLGSKDVSRQVATHAATNTGIDASILKKMLPVVATMVMGAMNKQAAGGGLSNMQPGASAAQSPLGGLLSSFLDANKDGSVVDDVLGMLLKR
jgi:hypothetical protein